MAGSQRFLRFSAHWGFRIRASRQYRAQTKGQVERPAGSRFVDVEHRLLTEYGRITGEVS